MVDTIIEHGNAGASEKLKLQIKDISIEKLPEKNSENLREEVSQSCKLILSFIEEEKWAYIKPEELIEKARLFQSKKGRKNNHDIYIQSAFGDNAEGLKNSQKLREHFVIDNFQNNTLHGYIFSDGKKQNIPLACIYEINIGEQIEEYILMDKCIADNPRAAHELLKLLKEKYKKLHKKYHPEK